MRIKDVKDFQLISINDKYFCKIIGDLFLELDKNKHHLIKSPFIKLDENTECKIINEYSDDARRIKEKLDV